MKLIYYTFETNPFTKELSDLFGEIFIFKKLNSDFEKFKFRILKEQPDVILGIAKTVRNFSYFDKNCFNQFGKNKKILKDAINKYDLFIPENNLFMIIDNLKTSKSFCNWTMYKINNYLLENNLKTKISFTHLKMEDIVKLSRIIDSIRH